jgi:hypothetical protein
LVEREAIRQDGRTHQELVVEILERLRSVEREFDATVREKRFEAMFREVNRSACLDAGARTVMLNTIRNVKERLEHGFDFEAKTNCKLRVVLMPIAKTDEPDYSSFRDSCRRKGRSGARKRRARRLRSALPGRSPYLPDSGPEAA